MKHIIAKIWHLNLIIALRFLGLFIVMSVLSVYALYLPEATPTLAGLAVGGYALTQAMLQVPFGILSDRIGKKAAISIGLIIFAIGSLIAAGAEDIYTLLIGRFLQGAGAVSSVIVSTVSDFVKEDEKSYAMITIEIVIAISFIISMLCGPIIGSIWGVSSLFISTSAMAFISIILLFTVVPTPPKITHSFSKEEDKVSSVFKNANLKRMFAIFFFHSFVMATAFFIIPIVLKNSYHLPIGEFWKVYLPAVLLGVIAIWISAILGEKYNRGKEVFLFSIIIIVLAFSLMGFSTSLLIFGMGVSLFFIGFNMFEPLLQNYVSKYSKAHQKSISMGVAHIFSYLGVGLGGVIAGKVFELESVSAIAMLILIVAILWGIFVAGIKNPMFEKIIYLDENYYDFGKLKELKVKKGISDIYINKTEGIMVIKYNKKMIDEDIIREFMLKV